MGPMFMISYLIIFMIVMLPNYHERNDIEMASTGLLVVSNLSAVKNLLSRAFQHVNRTLYIALKPSDEMHLASLSKYISSIYTQSTYLSDEIDVRILLQNERKSTGKMIRTIHPIEIILFNNKDLSSDVKNVVEHIANLLPNYHILNVDTDDSGSGNPIDKLNDVDPLKTYEYVALGGTFDRLHNGHKILLSEALLRSTKHLTVGVTDVNMIKSKKLWELIQPIETRIQDVKHFLEDVKPNLEYRVVPLHDIYGPTKEDPRLQLLVVSEETVKGGTMINEKRKESNLPLMDVYRISLASDKPGTRYLEEAKISSSNNRLRLLGTVLKEPEPRPNLPKHPYIIGLSGGIASGKSNITKYLGELGAGIINCDLLGHELYKPGQAMNATIAETFGRHVIADNGEVNRKILGGIVFGDKSQLQKLNSLMWPEIIKLAMQRANELYESGYKVVVLEAAVLIRGGWQPYCHQIWSTIISPEEAVRRLMERNNLTEPEAKERIASQPSNSEQVAVSNVVLSSLGTREFTRQQVENAWIALQKYL